MNYRINNFIDDFCDNNDVTPTELLSKYRKRELVEKRMVLSYFLKIKFDLTFDKIATIMNRTHASIIHYIKRLEQLLCVYPHIQKMYKETNIIFNSYRGKFDENTTVYDKLIKENERLQKRLEKRESQLQKILELELN